MAVVHRVNGGAAKYGRGGLEGDHLGEGHKIYKMGFNDFSDGRLPMSMKGSYWRGYSDSREQALSFQRSLDREKTRKTLGMSRGAFIVHLKYDVS